MGGAANVPFAAMNVLNVPFGTPAMSRTCRSLRQGTRRPPDFVPGRPDAALGRSVLESLQLVDEAFDFRYLVLVDEVGFPPVPFLEFLFEFPQVLGVVPMQDGEQGIPPARDFVLTGGALTYTEDR